MEKPDEINFMGLKGVPKVMTHDPLMGIALVACSLTFITFVAFFIWSLL